MFRFKLICSGKELSSVQLLDASSYSFDFHFCFDEVLHRWTDLCPKDIFWEAEFMRLVEKHGPEGIRPIYCVVKKDHKDIGVAYFQLKKVALKEALNDRSEKSEETTKENLKSIVSSRINFYNLVCGNMLITGKYGFHFPNDNSNQLQFSIIHKAIDELISLFAKEKIDVGTVLIKDFFDQEAWGESPFSNFTSFLVQPNMIMNINNWITFDDYVNEMKAKYRTRVHRAFKKCGRIEKKEMNLEDIFRHQKVMHAQYKNIALNAGFNLFIHKEDYFYRLKEALKDELCLIGYFYNEELVGFYTMMHNHEHLDAHFLGYDYRYNAEFQLYLNMLYDMIRYGIDKKFKKIVMSRTAMEIKSSVGAEAYEMACYLRHNKKLYNHFVPTILKYLNPKQEWLPRSPFKDEE